MSREDDEAHEVVHQLTGAGAFYFEQDDGTSRCHGCEMGHTIKSVPIVVYPERPKPPALRPWWRLW